jgi:hypothetical protein
MAQPVFIPDLNGGEGFPIDGSTDPNKIIGAFSYYVNGDKKAYPVTLADIAKVIPSYALDVHKFGAKGDAVSLADATVAPNGVDVSSVRRPFRSSDVGKIFYGTSSWEQVPPARQIVSVANGVATLDASITSGSGQRVMFGTDDTLAFEAAFEAASKSMYDVPFSGGGNEFTAAWRYLEVGNQVRMRGGHAYMVKNTQERYESGKHGAINIKRNCGLAGAGSGQTAI